MFEQFFSFKENPFNLTPDTEYLFLSSVHREAHAHLLYAIKQKKGFSVLTGEIGTGKTTLCRALLKQLPENTQVAHILSSRLSCEELFRSILVDLGVDSGTCNDKVQLIHKLHEFLLTQLAEGNSVIVIIDEAQNLDAAVLEELRMISNLETEKEKLVQVMLVGQPELRQLLNHPQLKQFRQRISIRYHLGPMTNEDTKKYILHRLKVASGDRQNLTFADEAIREIYFATQGIPRLVNIVCENILLSAYVAEKFHIDEYLVKDVLRELAQDEILPSRPVEMEDNYRHFYHLKDDPFHFNPNSMGLVPDLPVDRLVKEVLHIVESQPAPIVVTGDQGTGKTLLSLVLQQELKKKVNVCFLDEPQKTIADFEVKIYQGFQLQDVLRENKQTKFDQNLMWDLYQFFLSKSDNNSTPVLIIDNADKLSLQCAQDIGLWINYMESGCEMYKLLQLVLVGTPLVMDRIRVIEFASNNNKLFHKLHLNPLSVNDINVYIKNRLQSAGAIDDFIQFTPDALYTIALISKGNPKLVNKICTGILHKAFDKKMRVIDSAFINNIELIENLNGSQPPRSNNILTVQK